MQPFFGAFCGLGRWVYMSDDKRPYQEPGIGPAQDPGPKKPVPEIPVPEHPDRGPVREAPVPDVQPDMPAPSRAPEIEPQNPDVVEIPNQPDAPEVGVPARDLPGGILH